MQATTLARSELALVGRMIDSGELTEAQTRIDALRSRYPDQAQLEYFDAVVAYRRGQFDRARSTFIELLRRDPPMHRAWYGLGLVDEQTGRRDEAVDAYQRLLVFEPGFPPALARLRELGAAAEPHSPSAPRAASSVSARTVTAPSARVVYGRPASGRRAITPSISSAERPARRPMPRPLRRIVPLPVRIVRLWALVVLRLLAVASAAIAALAAWDILFNAENIDVGEAKFFGGIAAAVCVGCLLLVRAIDRLTTVKLRGIVDRPSFRQESGGRGRSRRKTRYVLSFLLRVTDHNQHRFPEVSVEMTLKPKAYHAGLAAGDEIIVKGRPRRHDYFAARSIRSVRTGLTLSR